MKKKSLPITRAAVYMIIGQALILLIGALTVSIVFFRRSATAVFEEMDRSITGAALYIVDEEVMGDIAKETLDIYNSLDHPLELYKNDPEAYYAAFRDLEQSEPYQTQRNLLNGMRRNTASTCITYVLLFPGENLGIYVIDASDVTVLPCGDLFEYDTSSYVGHPGKDFDSYISVSGTYGFVRTDGVPCCTNTADGIYSYLLADIPVSRLVDMTNRFALQSAAVSLLLTILICLGVTAVLRRFIHPLLEVTKAAGNYLENHDPSAREEIHVFDEISGGQIRELQDLTNSLTVMEQDMNQYVKNIEELTAEEARIHADLELAESIQSNMLPNIFPAFPERSEFSIYAMMDPAREVGGDFYDFFLIDEDHLAMVIADVSGKGIPAALFMMMSKILVKNYTQIGLTPKQVLEKVNNVIVQNNENDMFVTVWLGIMTISTGRIICSNAGHEYPILKKQGGLFEMITDRHGVAVGAMANMKYTEYELELHTGDTLFVYTDGLPEATNREDKQFGTGRILEVLNSEPDAEVEDLFVNIGIAVAEFVQDSPQFDDLTMLAISGKDIPRSA